MAVNRATFILRLWREQSAPAGEWYSEVEHLPSGHICHFADLPAFFTYFQARLASLEQGENRHESPPTPDCDP